MPLMQRPWAFSSEGGEHMPGTHSLLSPSSAHRWLLCTAAPHYEAQFPNTSSKFAAEGTLAHSVCELHVRKAFDGMTTRKFNSELKKLQADPLYSPDMLTSAAFYIEYLTMKANSYPDPPYISPEEKVDLSEWIPGGFGTCDCIMIGGSILHITDYKNGVGEIVSAVDNPQMRLYALGTLKKYELIYGDTIKTVSMAIVQPRVTEDVSEDSMTTTELLAWGETVKPIAKEASDGPGVFNPGAKQCRFCRGREVCAARAASMLALEQYKDRKPEGRLTQDQAAEAIINGSGIITDAEVGDILKRGEQLVNWYKDLQSYALQAILDGRAIPGYKAVEGRSVRQWTDLDSVVAALHKAGYDDAAIYDRELKTLTGIEKLLGKKRFNEILSPLVVKPAGKPTLAEESDKREALNPAVNDFADLAETLNAKTSND